MATAKLYPLSYAQARNLGQPMQRPPGYVKAHVNPTRRPRPIRGLYGLSPLLHLDALMSLGQEGATITLPDGRDHVVRAVNPSGEILTTDGWQSTTLPGGVEQWVDTRTGDVMHADGTITRAAQPFAWTWWLVGGAGVLGVGVLALMPRRRGVSRRGARRRRRR